MKFKNKLNELKFIQLILFNIFFIHVSPSQNVKDSLSINDKIFGLSKIWQEINYNYAFIDKVDFDIDSLYNATIPKIIAAKDSYEYHFVLSNFIKNFKYGHTSILTNQFFWDGVDFPPFKFKKEDDDYYVTQMNENLINEVPINSKIIEVDGLTPSKAPKLKYRFRNGLMGYKNSKLLIKFETPKGKIVEKEFIRNLNSLFKSGNLNLVHKIYASSSNKELKDFSFIIKENISIVELNSFQNEQVINDFKSAIDEINNTKGLIIDIRNNGGGNGNYAVKIAEHLVKQDYLLTESWKTRVNNSLNKAYGSINVFDSENSYAKEYSKYYFDYQWEEHKSDTIFISKSTKKITVPIVVLTSGKTYSAAEDFVIYLSNDFTIKRIGLNTAGNSGQPLFFNIPGGYTVSISAKRDTLPNGEEYIGIGVKPDVLLSKNKNVLEYALNSFLK